MKVLVAGDFCPRNRVATAFEKEDYANYTIKVHALKSSARIVGASKLGEEAQELENAGKSRDVSYIKAHHPEFIDYYHSFKEPLSIIFVENEVDESSKPEADLELMDIVYREIKAAADDMNCDRLEEIFKKMEEYRIPQSEKEIFSKIKTASENYEYDSILDILSEV